MAVAILGAKDIAIETAGVHADQHAFSAGHVAAHQHHVEFGGEIAGVGDGAEFAGVIVEHAFGHAADELLVLHSVADEFGENPCLVWVAD